MCVALCVRAPVSRPACVCVSPMPSYFLPTFNPWSSSMASPPCCTMLEAPLKAVVMMRLKSCHTCWPCRHRYEGRRCLRLCCTSEMKEMSQALWLQAVEVGGGKAVGM